MAALSFKKYIRLTRLRLLRMRGTPREVALGMAVGLFVGLMPILFQVPVAVVFAALLRCSKLAAAIGSLFSNPVTNIPIFYTTYLAGALVLGRDPNPAASVEKWVAAASDLQSPAQYLGSFVTLALSDYAAPLWVGAVVVGLPLGALGYWVTLQAVTAYRLKKLRMKAKNRARWIWDPEKGWHKPISSPLEKE